MNIFYKIKGAVDKTVEMVTRPVCRYPFVWVLGTVLLGVTAGITFNFDGFEFEWRYFCYGCMQALVLSYLVCFLLCLVKKGWVKWPFIALFLILFYGDVYCLLQFKSRIDTNVMSIILQSDGREISEFIKEYILGLPVLISLLITAGVFFAIYVLRRKIEYLLSMRFIKALVVVAMLASLFVWIGLFRTDVYHQCRPIPLQYALAIKDVLHTKENIDNLEATLDGKYVLSVGDRPAVVVMLIGESFNKHHSSLYGYGLDTNPYLSKEVEAGRLVPFNDVVSKYCFTEKVMPEIMTLHTQSDTVKWSQSPLLPFVFRQAGYKVSYINNQASRAKNSIWDFSAFYFLNSAKINSACFDYRNSDIYQYDEDVLPEIKSALKGEEPRFLIVQLMGQHFMASMRYPQKFKRFKESQYNASLSLKAREDLAHYDNATLYNDYVVNEVIELLRDKDAVMVYFSDHGEEVHDFREEYGRTWELPDKNLARCLYEVPMMIWYSDKYLETHPQKVESIKKAAEKPFVNGDVAQMMLSLGEIRSDWYRPEYNPLDSLFKPHRRVLYGGYDYDNPRR